MKAITFFGSARLASTDAAYIQAKNLAFKLGKLGCAIITGGGGGIMQAANHGAYLAKAQSVGINIKLPHEQKPNEFCSELKIHTDLSARRKELIARADGFVVCAGGFGTLDELFEVLTLSQTKLDSKPIILLGKAFWQPLVSWLEGELVRLKLIDSEPIYLCSDDEAQCIKYLGLDDENHK